ncbi:MAG TPA: peroxiredoxin family protein [Candidatus Eisenbacteria bacterium]
MRFAALVLAAVTVLASPTLAQPPDSKSAPPATPRTTPGAPTPQARVHIYGQVYIGERAPEFTLDSSDGKVIRLSRFRGDWLVLVFADRKEKLGPLASVHDELKGLGVRVLAVCREKAHNLQTYATRNRLPFVLGADWTGEIASLYGLFDGERSMISPGFLLVDRDGIVRMALFGQNLPPDQIAALVRFAVTGL